MSAENRDSAGRKTNVVYQLPQGFATSKQRDGPTEGPVNAGKLTWFQGKH